MAWWVWPEDRQIRDINRVLDIGKERYVRSRLLWTKYCEIALDPETKRSREIQIEVGQVLNNKPMTDSRLQNIERSN
jgi:hypothetical protein